MAVVNIVLVVILLALVIQAVWSYFSVKKAAKLIDNAEFKEKMRNAQIIDVRDKATFDANHIMGARSFPTMTLKQTSGALRKDMPILLYDARRQQAGRAAVILKKQGFTDIYILKTGYDGWDGRTKAKKM
ncbi:Rhodanese-related sulfurtransferase [Pilibacter termitis]|uniref:Rhodanese-related sulfurtransferase n=1 Tax=Pilibacter termitis TaxID=263852 RepID=A0A1T4PTU5_9ENTE|nr:rhodanese-like domain-containing protein [Pilibacter termitis]SJZ94736.1 Rhodanese-related sulfurtransferase [Pilibacter termitis]